MLWAADPSMLIIYAWLLPHPLTNYIPLLPFGPSDQAYLHPQITQPFQILTAQPVKVQKRLRDFHTLRTHKLGTITKERKPRFRWRSYRDASWDTLRSILARRQISVIEADLIVAGQEAAGCGAAEGRLIGYIGVAWGKEGTQYSIPTSQILLSILNTPRV